MFGYPPEVRIRKRRRYLDVQNSGRRINTTHFIVFVLPGETERTRIGITASKRIGNSVQRDRWKRIIREGYRQIQDEITVCVDMVFIIRRGVAVPSVDQVQKEILQAIGKWVNGSKVRT